MKSEFYIQHETSPWSVNVFSYAYERPLIRAGYLTHYGRIQIDRLLHVSSPMVDYSL
jgi:hypothetical protein